MSAHRDHIEAIADLYERAVKRVNRLKSELEAARAETSELHNKLIALSRDNAPVSIQPQRWGCRRCGHEVDIEAGRCGCTESPSPWEPIK